MSTSFRRHRTGSAEHASHDHARTSGVDEWHVV